MYRYWNLQCDNIKYGILGLQPRQAVRVEHTFDTASVPIIRVLISEAGFDPRRFYRANYVRRLYKDDVMC